MAAEGKIVLCSGEEMEIFEGNNRKEIQEKSNWNKNGVIKPTKGKWLLPKEYLAYDKMLYNFPFRTTDVFVNGFPKSGTTWVQEMVWTILHNTNLANPIKKESPFIRIPWFEGDILKDYVEEWVRDSICKAYNVTPNPNFVDLYEKLPNSRVFKSHLYTTIINPNMLEVSKVVYVIRNPMDSCLSYFYFHRYMTGLLGLTKDWAEFADIYIRGELFNGNAAEHILSWWPYRNHKNLHLILYENIKRDPVREIQKLGHFLEKDLTDDQIQNVVYQTTFNKMKEDAVVIEANLEKLFNISKSDEQSSFFRKGIVGDSKNMPKDIYNKLAAYFNEYLKDLDLPYNYTEL